MPELSPHAAPADRRNGRRRGRSARNSRSADQAQPQNQAQIQAQNHVQSQTGPAAPVKAGRNLATEKGLRKRIRSLVVTPVASVMVLAAGSGSMWHYAGNSVETWSVSGAAAVIGLAMTVNAARKAAAVAAAVHEQRVTNATSARQWVERFEAVTAEGQKSIAQLLEQISRGERPQLPEALPHPVSQGNPFADLEQTLRLAQHQALAAVAEAGARQQVDVFVNIAQRLHALVNRALARLDNLESEVEDPDLLGGLFGVDHLVTQFRRQVESLAVMGGAVPRRINKPVPLPTVLRQGVAEIEQYARVRVIQPPEGTLPGYAAAEVIHLLAELVENAARFSAPETQVTLRAERVPAGLAIEIDDRGLPMAPDKLERMNRLLTRPDQFDIRAQLEDGRIGLFVVAQIARRHDIDVALRRNIYGGTQAVVVLPSALLDSAAPAPAQRQGQEQGRSRQQEHAPEHTPRTQQTPESPSDGAWPHPQPTSATTGSPAASQFLPDHQTTHQAHQPHASASHPTPSTAHQTYESHQTTHSTYETPQTHQTPQAPQTPHQSPYGVPQHASGGADHRGSLPAEAGARGSRNGRGSHGESSTSVRRIGSPAAHAAAAAAAAGSNGGNSANGSSNGTGGNGELPLPQRKSAYAASTAHSGGAHAGSRSDSPYLTGNHQDSGHQGGGRPPATAHPNPGPSSAGRSTTGSADIPPEVPRSTPASPPSDAGASPGRRPTLPRRSETYRGPEFPRLADADRQVVAPNPDLMARFASGIRLASSEDGPQGPPDQTS